MKNHRVVLIYRRGRWPRSILMRIAGGHSLAEPAAEIADLKTSRENITMHLPKRVFDEDELDPAGN